MDPLGSNSILDGLGTNPTPAVPTSDPNQALKQADFFALLTQQLSYQDPTKPVENDQMISQMTSFTMADGISSMNESFADFAASMTSNQALQASSLVGQQVLVPGDVAAIEGEGGTSGAFSIPQSVQSLQVRIEDGAGQLIRTIEMGNLPPGKHRFAWDGLDNNGNRVEEGQYKINAQGSMGNEGTTFPVSTYAHVQSVSIGANGTGLSINTNLGSVKLAEVEEIGEG
ncbi:MAG: flagellar basal-body rod modification protein FlgD [Alteromonadaceae bacterium]